MKRHLMASPVSGGLSEGRAVRRVLSRPPTTFNRNTRSQTAAANEPNLALATETVRRHTLVLTGELHYRSAHALEAEIERLCEEGISRVTLDLCALEYIDANGIAVIAFRSALCKRRGAELDVIAGSRIIHRALEQAGVSAELSTGGD
jgi:anti-anti-sigma factor